MNTNFHCYKFENCLKLETSLTNSNFRIIYFARNVGIIKLVYSEAKTGFTKIFQYEKKTSADSGSVSFYISPKTLMAVVWTA